MMTKLKLFSASLLFAAGTLLNGQSILGMFNFEGGGGSDFGPSSLHADVAFSNLSVGNNPSGLFYTSSTTNGTHPDPILVTGTAARDLLSTAANNSYISFTLSPQNGASFDLQSITFDASRGGGSDRGLAVATSSDGFATFLPDNLPGGLIETQATIYSSYTVDASSLLGISTDLEVRFYLWSSADANTIYLDDISVNAVPEPSTYVLLTSVLAFGFVAYRRHLGR